MYHAWFFFYFFFMGGGVELCMNSHKFFCSTFPGLLKGILFWPLYLLKQKPIKTMFSRFQSNKHIKCHTKITNQTTLGNQKEQNSGQKALSQIWKYKPNPLSWCSNLKITLLKFLIFTIVVRIFNSS